MSKSITKLATGPHKLDWSLISERFRGYIQKNRNVLTALLVFIIVTTGFMWPIISNPVSYSDGGDHMFNAWTLARNHHCILREGCEKYSDSNIFFPHTDTMLYSETQLSTGILTLPLYFINHNPLFAANIWQFITNIGAGFFMYLLARYLSRGKSESLSIFAGLLFEFAPTKMTAMGHLQNLSIFYIPLIILLLLKYRDAGKRSYLIGFTLACSLLFLASWYQMMFGLVIIGVFLVYVLIFKESRMRGWWLSAAVAIAIATTLPLAMAYTRFSKANQATFSISNQIEFSASVNDYVLPSQDTLLGSLYYKLRPNVHRNSFNPDSFAYAGITLYVIMALCLLAVFWQRRVGYLKLSPSTKPMVLTLCVLFLVGFLISLGPVIKIGSQYSYGIQGLQVVIPAPYIIVDTFLPQLSFIRAIGRASVIPLFALCCLLAIFAGSWNPNLSLQKKYLVIGLLIAVMSFELLPLRDFIVRPFSKTPAYKTMWTIPAVYEYIHDNKSINDIVVIRTKKDYTFAGVPFAQAEDVLWAGYHNRNIFNGYSGFEPPEQRSQLLDFADLKTDDIPKMKKLGLKYVLADKELSDAAFAALSKAVLGKAIYEDSRYILFKL